MNFFSHILWFCGAAVLGTACTRHPAPKEETEILRLQTDKACYHPDDSVTFKIGNRVSLSGLHVRYRHLNEVLDEDSLHADSWKWLPPAVDYKGYLAEVFRRDAKGKETPLGTIAVDVSSDWSKFPRYGFLSHYAGISQERIEQIIGRLNRLHINGVQYQDWHWKHHQPAAGTSSCPAETWTDIALRPVEKRVVDAYIAETHRRGMLSIFYNLCFGALKDAETDGVSPNWFLYKDKAGTECDAHYLPAQWKSDIYLLDPGNVGWQRYLAHENENVYKQFAFDGFQIDQLGSRGTVYDAQGQEVDLPQAYESFIHAMRIAHPDKRLVMNAVSGFGQDAIACAGTDFFYNEVWADQPQFADLAEILKENAALDSTRATVFAAYMNYNVADSTGIFNTPGVLLTDAVMFALGASHLEAGEHLLCKEYFPNDNLRTTAELDKALIAYYDFLVAYENLLRDGGQWQEIKVDCTDGSLKFASWPPRAGCVSMLCRQVGNKQVLHLLNTSQADKLEWRDASGTMPEPDLHTDVSVSIDASRQVKRVWMASPDFHFGIPYSLEFRQKKGQVTLTLPNLKYWDMVVLEY